MAAQPQGDGKWTEYMKAFNGRLYRPDVAPADASLAPVEPGEPAVAPQGAGAPSTPQQASVPSSDGAFPRLAINNPLFEGTPVKRK